MAVGAVFLINGLGIATFLPRLPEVQQRLGLSDAGLGAALTGVGFGGLLGSLAAGAIVSRLGSRRATLVAGTVLGLALFPLGIAPSGAVLAIALAMVGFADAVTDIAMNAHGMRVQRLYPRPIVNGFHAAWSVGAMTGALLGSLAVALALPMQVQMAVLAVLVVVALWVSVGSFLADDPTGVVVPGVRPRLRGLGTLAVVALGTGIIEGAPGDWGAVYLEGTVGASAAVAGLGYTVFAGAMLLGRMVADRAVHRFGRVAVVRVGSLLGVAGFLIALAVPAVWGVMTGFAVAGIGLASLFPAMFAAGSEVPGLGEGVGIAGTSLLARIGFMIGPLAIGALADATGSLRWGLLLAPVAGLVVAVAARAVGERTTLEPLEM
jgi:MFS family permease